MQNPRGPRQGIMTELVKVVGNIKINSVSMQKQKKNPENSAFLIQQKGSP